MSPSAGNNPPPSKPDPQVRDRSDRFAVAWQVAHSLREAPHFRDFLPPPTDPERQTAFHALIKVDLVARWHRGQQIYLEAYLEKYPELGPPDELDPRLIHAEYQVRQACGQKPDLAEYQRRFPGQFAEIRLLVKEKLQSATPVVPLDTLSGSPAPRSKKEKRSSREAQMLPIEGGYKLIKRLGRGSFGEVWRAEAPGGVDAAVKIINQPVDHDEAQRELHALELTKRLHHPYLLQSTAFWFVEDRLYIAMELADGSLRDRLRECTGQGLSGIPVEELFTYVREAAEALDYLHSEQVQHRDIKPDNILILKRHAKVADFGLARLQESRGSVTSCGTPAYMAPEMWNGQLNANSDQYSLAMTYAELRLKRRVFEGTNLGEVMFCHLQKKPDLAMLGAAEQKALHRALAKEPTERYPSCLEFVRALDQALAQDNPAAPPVPTPPLNKWKLGTRIGVCLAALLVTMAGLTRLFHAAPGSPTLPLVPTQVPSSCQPAEGTEIVADEANRHYYHLIVCEHFGTPFELVLIPRDGTLKDIEDPPTYYIMNNKVWRGLYRAFARKAGRKIPNDWDATEKDNLLPATNVSIQDAHDFAQEVQGQLPTVIQWDKAAGLYENTTDEGPYRGRWQQGQDAKIAVGNKGLMSIKEEEDDLSSPHGCRNMAGNGREWTRNVFFPEESLYPKTKSIDDRVRLRGWDYQSDFPLTFQILRESHQLNGKINQTDVDLSFRIIIQP